MFLERISSENSSKAHIFSLNFLQTECRDITKVSTGSSDSGEVDKGPHCHNPGLSLCVPDSGLFQGSTNTLLFWLALNHLLRQAVQYKWDWNRQTFEIWRGNCIILFVAFAREEVWRGSLESWYVQEWHNLLSWLVLSLASIQSVYSFCSSEWTD